MLPCDETPALRRHWRYNLRLTAVFLAVWLVLILGTVLFARDLNTRHVFNIPLAYYLFAQGAPLAFLAIIGCYARLMNQADRNFLSSPSSPTSQQMKPTRDETQHSVF
ncbi:MAG TPA: DUF4212 domain-containing protein [Azoarcus sp.]|nr:DUF4212 domain-containing protein [Azoarcus sp.]